MDPHTVVPSRVPAAPSASENNVDAVQKSMLVSCCPSAAVCLMLLCLRQCSWYYDTPNFTRCHRPCCRVHVVPILWTVDGRDSCQSKSRKTRTKKLKAGIDTVRYHSFFPWTPDASILRNCSTAVWRWHVRVDESWNAGWFRPSISEHPVIPSQKTRSRKSRVNSACWGKLFGRGCRLWAPFLKLLRAPRPLVYFLQNFMGWCLRAKELRNMGVASVIGRHYRVKRTSTGVLCVYN